MNLDNRVANKIRNKARKQQEARDSLAAAREQGPTIVAATVFVGNQYTKSVVGGRYLAGDVQKFDLTEEENQFLGVLNEAFGALEEAREDYDRPSTIEGVSAMLRKAGVERRLQREFKKVLEGAEDATVNV